MCLRLTVVRFCHAASLEDRGSLEAMDHGSPLLDSYGYSTFLSGESGRDGEENRSEGRSWQEAHQIWTPLSFLSGTRTFGLLPRGTKKEVRTPTLPHNAAQAAHTTSQRSFPLPGPSGEEAGSPQPLRPPAGRPEAAQEERREQPVFLEILCLEISPAVHLSKQNTCTLERCACTCCLSARLGAGAKKKSFFSSGTDRKTPIKRG